MIEPRKNAKSAKSERHEEIHDPTAINFISSNFAAFRVI
jgi:hypothetical protein